MKKYIRKENTESKKSLPKAQYGRPVRGLKALKTFNPGSLRTLNPALLAKANKVRDMKAVNKVLNTPVLLQNLPSYERMYTIADRNPEMHYWYPTPEEAKAMKALFHLEKITKESERLKNAYDVRQLPYYPGPEFPKRETLILPNRAAERIKGSHGGGRYNPKEDVPFDLMHYWWEMKAGEGNFEDKTLLQRLQGAKDMIRDAGSLGLDLKTINFKDLGDFLKGGAIKSLSKFKKGGAMLKKMKTGGMVNSNSKVSVLKSAGSKGVKSGVNPKTSASKVTKGKVGGISKSPKTAIPKAMYGMSMKPGMMKMGGAKKPKMMAGGAMKPGMMKKGGAKKK